MQTFCNPIHTAKTHEMAFLTISIRLFLEMQLAKIDLPACTISCLKAYRNCLAVGLNVHPFRDRTANKIEESLILKKGNKILF